MSLIDKTDTLINDMEKSSQVVGIMIESLGPRSQYW